MTLKEANEYFASWTDHPPVSVLLKALVEGLGGSPSKGITDRDLFQLQREAGAAIPIVKVDPELSKFPGVVINLDAMRKKNAAAAVRLAHLNLSKDI